MGACATARVSQAHLSPLRYAPATMPIVRMLEPMMNALHDLNTNPIHGNRFGLRARNPSGVSPVNSVNPSSWVNVTEDDSSKSALTPNIRSTRAATNRTRQAISSIFMERSHPCPGQGVQKLPTRCVRTATGKWPLGRAVQAETPSVLALSWTVFWNEPVMVHLHQPDRQWGIAVR